MRDSSDTSSNYLNHEVLLKLLEHPICQEVTLSVNSTMSISDVLSNAKMPSIHNLSSVVGPAIVQAAVDNKVAAITIVSSLILIPVGGPTGLLLKGFGMGAGGVGAGKSAHKPFITRQLRLHKLMLLLRQNRYLRRRDPVWDWRCGGWKRIRGAAVGWDDNWLGGGCGAGSCCHHERGLGFVVEE